jgi:hypothetical protein
MEGNPWSLAQNREAHPAISDNMRVTSAKFEAIAAVDGVLHVLISKRESESVKMRKNIGKELSIERPISVKAFKPWENVVCHTK